jgi:hypothetical protein
LEQGTAKVKEEKPKKAALEGASKSDDADKCQACGKTVFMTEKVSVGATLLVYVLPHSCTELTRLLLLFAAQTNESLSRGRVSAQHLLPMHTL